MSLDEVLGIRRRQLSEESGGSTDKDTTPPRVNARVTNMSTDKSTPAVNPNGDTATGGPTNTGGPTTNRPPPPGATPTRQQQQQALQVNLDQARKKRGIQQGRVTKAITAVDNALAASAAKSQLDSLRDALQEKFHDFKTAHDAVLTYIDDEPSLQREDRRYEEIEENVRQASVKIITVIDKTIAQARQDERDQDPIQAVLRALNSATRHKLPELGLPTFDGEDPTLYPSFWAAFQALVDSREDVHDATKLTYLQEACNGAAYRVIMSFKPENNGYQNAVAKLQERFGGRRTVYSQIIRRVVDVKGGYKTITDQRKTYDFLTNEMTILEQMGINPKDAQVAEILIPVFEAKLAHSMLKKWELWLGEKDKRLQATDGHAGEEYKPTLAEFFAFVNTQLSADERVKFTSSHAPYKEALTTDNDNVKRPTASALVSNTGARPKQPPNKSNNGQKPATTGSSRPTTSRDSSQTHQDRPKQQASDNSKPRAPIPCIYCNVTGHSALQCKSNTDMSTIDRWNLVRQKKACFTCLVPFHQTQHCVKQHLRCSVAGCNAAHHTSLHMSA